MASAYWALIFVLGIGWGASFAFNEILLAELGPLTVSFERVAVGALGCWAWVLARRIPVRLSAREVGQLTILGIFNFAAPFAIYPLAQEHIAGGVAGIVNALTPIATVVISHFWPGGERATRLKVGGVVCGFAGIVILAAPEIGGGSPGAFWAIMLACLAPVSYAIALNYVRRVQHLVPAVLAAVALTGGALAIMPVALLREGLPHLVTIQGWASMLAIGLVLTSASFILLYWLLARVGGTAVSTVTFVAPVSAVLLGVWLLNETIGRQHILGMAAILAGLLLIDGRVARLWARRSATDP